MRRKYRLEPYNGLGPPLEFEWDPATGELGGRDAEKVRAWAEEAKREGYCVGDPYPTPHKIFDPLRRPGELAVILGRVWRLPPDLAASYPKVSGDIPPGAVA